MIHVVIIIFALAGGCIIGLMMGISHYRTVLNKHKEVMTKRVKHALDVNHRHIRLNTKQKVSNKQAIEIDACLCKVSDYLTHKKVDSARGKTSNRDSE